MIRYSIAQSLNFHSRVNFLSRYKRHDDQWKGRTIYSSFDYIRRVAAVVDSHIDINLLFFGRRKKNKFIKK